MAGESIRLTRRQLYEKVWSQPIRKLASEWGISDVGLVESPPSILDEKEEGWHWLVHS
jgi:hypothetical protein